MVAGAMVLVAVYSSVAGLLGIAMTDFVQFVIAMAGCIILAVIVLDTPEVGGVAGLKAKLPAWRLDGDRLLINYLFLIHSLHSGDHGQPHASAATGFVRSVS